MDIRITALLVITALAASCQPPLSAPAPEQEPSAGQLVWPQPPLPSRIRFVKAMAQPADLGIRPSLWRLLLEIMVGKEENWFVRPTGVAVDREKIYVADPGAQSLWILDEQAGRFSQVRGPRGEELVSPVSVSLGRAEKIYVADSYLRKILVFDHQGNKTSSIENDSFRRPTGLAYDAAKDRLYVADSAAHRIWILTSDGRPVGEIGRRGRGHGEFNFPTHVALDREGHLYVTDSLGFRIQIFARDGRFLGAFGDHGDGSGDFAAPKGVGVNKAGHIYVVDTLFDAVQIFDRTGRFLLSFGQRGVGLGQFWLPSGIFIDARDRIYVADSYNQRIQVFDYLPEGSDG